MFSAVIPEPYQIATTNYEYIHKRLFSENNLFNLKHMLSLTDLSDLYSIRDVNEAWSYFWQNLLYCLDITCPITKTKTSLHKNKNNWIDKDIVEESQKLKNLYWLSKNINRQINEQYKFKKRIYASKLQFLKREFYYKRIKDSTNRSKEIWYIVNSNMGRTDSRKFFITFFPDITTTEIENQLSQMQNKSSSGPDGIPIKVLKYISQFIIQPLCYIFNLSIKSGIFPNNLKLSTVIPLHKKGETNLIESYRPITVPS